MSRAVRERRAKLSQSQAALAKRLNSSQSRVAKMEAADPTVSVDLLLKALFALGATPREVATAIRRPLPPGRVSTAASQENARATVPRSVRAPASLPSEFTTRLSGGEVPLHLAT